VVHHPTVLAAYGEGRNWTFEGDAEVKSKFWGRSIELTPVGILELTFHDGEIFSWSKACTSPSQLLLVDYQIIARTVDGQRERIFVKTPLLLKDRKGCV